MAFVVIVALSYTHSIAVYAHPTDSKEKECLFFSFNSVHAGKCFMFLLSSAGIFQNQLFQKLRSGTLSECQTVWIQIRTDVLLVLIRVQTVCKGDQQTIQVVNSKERAKKYHIWTAAEDV